VTGVAPRDSLHLETFECRYGVLSAPSRDSVITRSLRCYGEWAEHELSILRPFVSPGTIVVDVGANVGTHTLPFSRWVQNGRVIAIEAQPAISRVLRQNCLQNGRHNVDVVNAVCAENSGSRKLRVDYTKEENFGAISFFDTRNGISQALARWLDRLRGCSAITIPAIRLDDLCTNASIALIKFDIEGMELDALRGARKTLLRCRPAVYFEQNSAARLTETYDYLVGAGYRLFWLETHPYNQLNFRGAKENIWWRTETGILALPAADDPPSQLIEVRRNDRSPPHLLNARDGIAVQSQC